MLKHISPIRWCPELLLGNDDDEEEEEEGEEEQQQQRQQKSEVEEKKKKRIIRSSCERGIRWQISSRYVALRLSIALKFLHRRFVVPKFLFHSGIMQLFVFDRDR